MRKLGGWQPNHSHPKLVRSTMSLADMGIVLSAWEMTCAASNFQYKARAPENSLLYETVRDYFPAFMELCSQDGKGLPAYIVREFEDFLRCGQLYYGFTR